MRLNTIFLAALLAVTAILFIYCAKETPASSTAPVKQLTLRGGPCNLTLSTTNGIDVCGTQANAVDCGTVNGIDLQGQDFIGPNGSTTYTVTPPCVLLVSRNPGFLDTDLVTVIAETDNGKEEYAVPLNGTVQINVDDNCTPF